MRVALYLLLLGGCDIVFGLDAPPTLPELEGESRTHDEDGDGLADALDLCPHDPTREASDLDGDGIGDRCDPRPQRADARYFFAFENGDHGRLEAIGSLETEDDAVILGSTEATASLTLVLAAGVVDLVAEIEVLDHIDPRLAFSEIGFFAVNRAFTPDKAMRGDNCYLGMNSAPNPMYLEFNNDALDLPNLDARFADELRGKRGPLAMSRDDQQIRCELRDAAKTFASGGPHAIVPRPLVGNVAVTTENARVRLRYLFVVTPRP